MIRALLFVSLAACSSSTDSPPPSTFTVTVEIDGAGTVQSNPAGLSCTGGAACPAATFDVGSVVLTATPAANNHVDRWVVDGVNTGAAPQVIYGAANESHDAKVLIVAD